MPSLIFNKDNIHVEKKPFTYISYNRTVIHIDYNDIFNTIKRFRLKFVEPGYKKIKKYDLQ